MVSVNASTATQQVLKATSLQAYDIELFPLVEVALGTVQVAQLGWEWGALHVCLFVYKE